MSSRSMQVNSRYACELPTFIIVRGAETSEHGGSQAIGINPVSEVVGVIDPVTRHAQKTLSFRYIVPN